MQKSSKSEEEELKERITQKNEFIRELEKENLRLEAELDKIHSRLEAILDKIHSSLVWKFLVKFFNIIKKFAPIGMNRGKIVNLTAKSAKIIIDEGFSEFRDKLKEYRKDKIIQSSQEWEDNYIHFPTKNKFRVLYIVGPPDSTSVRYRVDNFIEYLSDFGISAEYIFHSKIRNDDFQEILCFDLLVLFRVAMDDAIENLIDKCRKVNLPVIFDVDDYVFELKIANVKTIDGIRFLPNNILDLYFDGIKRYRKTLLSCDYFTTTTEFLAERGRELGKQTFVLKNGLNKELIRINAELREDYVKTDSFIRIGYYSGTKTHQKDFAVAVNAIENILQEYNNIKLVIAGLLDIHEFPNLKKFYDRIEFLPLVPWKELPKNLIKSDINLVPLEAGNPFCEAKSELKYVEAALLKIPSVSSNTSPFISAIKDGFNGFIAGNENEWYEKLKMLIEDENLRKEIGNNAYDHILENYTPNALSKILLERYEEIISDVRKKIGMDENNLSIGIILPSPFLGSGGHMRIFEIASYFTNRNHKVKIYITDIHEFKNSMKLKNFIHNNYIETNFEVILGTNKITSHDILIATHWSTVYIVNKYKDRAKKTLYFVQDYEPYFYQMGEDYVYADLSYRQLEVIVTYGEWCREFLKHNNNLNANQKSYWIHFYVNKEIFHPIPEIERKQNRVIFFARPHMQRRLYRFGISALKILASKKPDVEIVFFGSEEIDSSKIPFNHNNLGHLPTEYDLAQLYNSATIGVIFTTTNPSMTSFEMMACKCPIIDIDYNDNKMKYGSEDNVMLVKPTPKAVAEGIIKLLENNKLRDEISKNGFDFAWNFPRKEESLDKLEKIIKAEVN